MLGLFLRKRCFVKPLKAVMKTPETAALSVINLFMKSKLKCPLIFPISKISFARRTFLKI